MSVSFITDVARTALRSAASLHRDATALRNRTVDIGADNLMDFMNRMRETYDTGIERLRHAGIPDDPEKTDEELNATRDAIVRGFIQSQTFGGPLDTHARTVEMKAALEDLYVAYRDNCHPATFATFTAEAGGEYSRVSDLSPLYPALDRIIAATVVYAD